MSVPVIEAHNLTKYHVSSFLGRKFCALNSLNLQINEGETFGLLGLNGAGKTTCLKLMLGLIKPSSGYVNILGAKAGSITTLAKIGFLPENPYFYSYLTGWEFLNLAACLSGVNKLSAKQKIEELLERVTLTSFAKLPIRQYSKGMLQRLGIAQSLINNPDIILWDEPTAGLDPVGRTDVRTILNDLKCRGKTVFLNTHLLPDVSEVCDQIGILHHGKLINQTKISSILTGGSYKNLEEYFFSQIRGADTNC